MIAPVAASAPRPVPARAAAAPQPARDPNHHPGLEPGVIAERVQKGRIAENTADVLPPDVARRGAPQYFRTYEQVKSAMFDLQRKYPDLVQVKDIGDSSEKVAGRADRDIWALTLTNRKATGPKPVVEHLAGVHAREIANPELLLTWAKQLVEGYGRDPEATALLNTREIDLIPMVNPDGHAVVERGYARQPGGDLMQRKNTAAPAGTDINRNFEFHWGGAGASSSPRSETYRGPHAASEPETQAVQRYTEQRKPAMFTDWHSYSRLNMYPWGDTREKAPHYEGLKAVAEKYSTFNHYSPIQAVQLYPTTGTTDDHAYGRIGSPAWGIETGDSFHQDDRQFAQTLRENLPVLWYGAKIADAPFQRVKGPDTLEVMVDPASRKVSARVSDQTSGRDSIRGAELVLDPATAPGKGVPLAPIDGRFDGTTEQVAASIAKVPGIGPGTGDGTLVYVRGQDGKGNWGPLTAQWLSGSPAEAQAAR